MNKRIFIQQKPQFDIHSKKVTKELQNLVPGIACKVFVSYDLFEISENQLEQSVFQVFADPVTDLVIDDLSKICHPEPVEGQHPTSNYFAIEPLPGQYDQRADSADQCLQLLGFREPEVK